MKKNCPFGEKNFSGGDNLSSSKAFILERVIKVTKQDRRIWKFLGTCTNGVSNTTKAACVQSNFGDDTARSVGIPEYGTVSG